jgi:hypothetical protein
MVNGWCGEASTEGVGHRERMKREEVRSWGIGRFVVHPNPNE